MKKKEKKTLVFHQMAVLSRGCKRYLRKGEEEGIFAPRYMLAIADHDGLSQDELAKLLHIDKGAVAKRLRQLEEEGLVLRRQSDTDRRRYGIHLTEEGKAQIPKMKRRAMDLEEILCEGLTEEEKACYLACLDRSLANLSRYFSEERGEGV